MASAPVAADAGTREERSALFDYLLKATMERTAFSPYVPAIPGRKEQTMAAFVRAGMRRFRAELLDAKSDEELWYALARISNARWDSHLKLMRVPGGVTTAREREPEVSAPIRFRPDYRDLSAISLFVADTSEALAREASSERVGDRLTAVNGVPIARYLEEYRAYFGLSSWRALWWQMAAELPRKSARFPRHFYRGEEVTFELETRAGTRYQLTLPYLDEQAIAWRGVGEYGGERLDALDEAAAAEVRSGSTGQGDLGFVRVLESPSFDAYVSNTKRVVLLKAHRFHASIGDTLARLLAYASAHDSLDYAVIFDLTRGYGGDLEEYTLQRLQPKPFRVMRGNLRISDVTPALARELEGEARAALAGHPAKPRERAATRVENADSGALLLGWLGADLAAAIRHGQAYTNDVPFKNQFLAASSDGVLYPAAQHFRGPIVLFTAPHSCSGADQFAAMFIDNALGLSVGMPEGGCSNTWEWEEVLRLPGSRRPLARFAWSAGHSIRPNGEVLEGNPAEPDVSIPLTRDNHRVYYRLLMERALAYIEAQRHGAPRAPTWFERVTHKGVE